MIKQFKFLCFLAAFMLIGTFGFSQKKIPPGNPRNPNSPQIPIDGGISLLAAAGVAYGVKKVYESRKASNPEQGKE